MWILTEAPKGSMAYDPQSTTGNLALISDTCDTVIFARSQGMEGHRIVAMRGRDTFLIGPAPEPGVAVDLRAQMLDVAKQLHALIVT
jgi:hypothetical protein